ncbi:MAG: cytochrome c4 [Betaproteobacteria bacterium]|nr:cytochrome c4 [Betaproteobacteria bacterium]
MRFRVRHFTKAALVLGFGLACAASAAPGKGDAAKGAALAAQSCSSCHGPDGNSAVAAFPKLAGQQEQYLAREMKDFKEGRRESEVMAPFLVSLNDQDLADLAAFYAKQKPAAAKGGDAALIKAGKKLYLEGNSKSGVPSCDGCHEEDGTGSKKFPRVAGQHVDYILEQMRLYAAGKRKNGVKVMLTVAERLTEQETRAVSEYMASME